MEVDIHTIGDPIKDPSLKIFLYSDLFNENPIFPVVVCEESSNSGRKYLKCRPAMREWLQIKCKVDPNRLTKVQGFALKHFSKLSLPDEQQELLEIRFAELFSLSDNPYARQVTCKISYPEIPDTIYTESKSIQSISISYTYTIDAEMKALWKSLMQHCITTIPSSIEGVTFNITGECFESDHPPIGRVSDQILNKKGCIEIIFKNIDWCAVLNLVKKEVYAKGYENGWKKSYSKKKCTVYSSALKKEEPILNPKLIDGHIKYWYRVSFKEGYQQGLVERKKVIKNEHLTGKRVQIQTIKHRIHPTYVKFSQDV